MNQLLAAVRAAVRDPRRVLACLRACDGVDLAVVEIHDAGYNLQHVHDLANGSAALVSHYERRLQDVVAERNRLTAALKAMNRAYVNLLENGRDRIVALGGQCDSVDVMEASDPSLRASRAALAAGGGVPA